MELKSDLFNLNKKLDEMQNQIKILQSQNNDLNNKLVVNKEESDLKTLQKINTIRDLDEKIMQLKIDNDRYVSELN